MTITPKHMLIAAAAALLTSCGDGNKSETTETTDTATAQAANAPATEVTLTDFPSSPDFPDAKISLGTPVAMAKGDSVSIDFSFNVQNYELKSQTPDAANKNCNNSKDGQHIHFILDSKPYVALYEPKHTATVSKNSEHYLMAFLSRSYHESIKHTGAALVFHFKVDENGKMVKMDDPKTPMIFYSRPKGDYLGKDVENVLFDFYPWNVTLGADYKVMADINGTVKTIDAWKPYFLKGLPMGKNSIKLTLVDKDGKKVDGPMTEVTREFNLAADEPMR